MVKPLDKLEVVNLNSVTIEEIISNSLCKEAIQLPQILIKISIINLRLVGSPALFVETMNSHSSLKEFLFDNYNANVFFIPFNTH
jgi:hypothetical protein